MTFDPYEFGARNADPELGALQPLPPAPKRIPTLQLLAYFVAGVVVVAVLRGVGRPAPAAEGSCADPGFRLSATDVDQFGVLKWSATGPAEGRVVLGLDTSGVPVATGKLAGPVALTGCRASGQFGMPAAAGEHRVVAYLLRPDGSSTVVSTVEVTVS